MGLWEFLQQWQRGRVVVGAVVSILVHVLLVAGLLWGLGPDLSPKWRAKPGDDTLIVELPKPDERGAAGTPAAAPPPGVARPAPPTPPRREAPAPREERRVASTPPRPAQPAPPARRAPEPAPAPKAAPPAPRPVEPPASEPTPAPAEPAPAAAQPTPRAEPAPQSPAPPVAEPRRESERQVASVPPGGPTRPSVTDVRAALRAGAGGQGQGRGGIDGDPIPLDSADARYTDYLDQVRRKIKEKWGFPCVKNPRTRECEVHTTSLDVQFGILKDGRVQFVEITRVADHAVYDEYAVNAIKLAAPFPPVPAVMLQSMRAGSTGIPISARFSYVVESSLTNLLR